LSSPPSAPATEIAGLPDLDALVQAWQYSLTATSLAALGPRGLRAFLTELAEDLLTDLRAETSEPAVPSAIGSRLLYAHLTDPDVLERSLAVLGGQLTPAMTGRTTRLADLLGGIAAGYANAVRERTRSEQEQITAAAFQARMAAEARFEAVFASAGIGIAVSEVAGTIVEVNPALCTMLGYPAVDLVGRAFWEFGHPDDAAGTWDRIRDVAAGRIEHLRMEKPLHRKDGATIRGDVVLSLVTAPDGQARYIVAMIEDVTRQRTLQDRLLYQALHDPMTELPNRRLFFERLDAALATAGTGGVGVCYLDLDGFKIVNDTLGHATGDELLRAVARRLDTALTPDGHLVARMGGDEFVILVEGRAGVAAAECIDDVAQTALETIRRPVELAGQSITVSASAGVVAHPSTDAHELMKAADATLYWAKADGGDRSFAFDPERYRADLERFAFAAQMPDALQRGEFVVEYQPLVRLADRRMIGVEALVRWVTADGERRAPETFVPLAEQSGLIVPLGRHVLRTACRDAAGWDAGTAGERLLVSVNVAARQIADPDFVDDVRAVLAETAWPAANLQLELTESAIMSGTSDSVATLRALQGMGVRIAIDDFGTGYSNFAYLRDLPVDGLKLAAPLVRKVAEDDGRNSVNARVVGLIVELARVLELSVVAESVETAVQAERLAALGCEEAQGWYFAPALAAEATAARVANPVFRPQA
jgi:diguanylate cyclase (GGDEF)-like protein/PAS domain S-box-containing protein